MNVKSTVSLSQLMGTVFLFLYPVIDRNGDLVL